MNQEVRKLGRFFILAGSDQSLVEISEDDQRRLLADYEEEMKNTSSAQHSRRSSGTQLSSSSSGSFAMVTVSHPLTNIYLLRY